MTDGSRQVALYEVYFVNLDYMHNFPSLVCMDYRATIVRNIDEHRIQRGWM